MLFQCAAVTFQTDQPTRQLTEPREGFYLSFNPPGIRFCWGRWGDCFSRIEWLFSLLPFLNCRISLGHVVSSIPYFILSAGHRSTSVRTLISCSMHTMIGFSCSDSSAFFHYHSAGLLDYVDVPPYNLFECPKEPQLPSSCSVDPP